MKGSNLTGRVRFTRESFFFFWERVVVEVEIKFGDGPDDYHGMPQYLAGTMWVKATPDHLINAQIQAKLKPNYP